MQQQKLNFAPQRDESGGFHQLLANTDSYWSYIISVIESFIVGPSDPSSSTSDNTTEGAARDFALY